MHFKIQAFFLAVMLPCASYAQSSSMDFAQIMQAARSSGNIQVDANSEGHEESELPIELQLQEAVKSIGIDDVVEVPIRSLKAVLSDGQINYISDNGRYILRGELVDVWHYKVLDTIDQVQHSVDYLYFNNLDRPIAELNTFSIESHNDSAKEVVAFVGPESVASRALVTLAKTLQDKYTFRFVAVPSSGPSSVYLTRKIACAKNKQQVLLAFESASIGSLDYHSNCDFQVHDETLLAADLMGVAGVPFIVAPNGRVSRGLPEDLESWLKEHSN